MSPLQRLRPIALAGLLLVSASASAAPQEWAIQDGTTMNDRTSDIAHDGAGGAFVVGSRFEIGAFTERQAFVQHVLPGGQVDWTHDLGAPVDEDQGFGVVLDGSGGALFAGSTGGDLGSGSHGGVDAFVASYTGQGQLNWVRQYGNAAFDGAKAICADGAGGYFLAGWSFGGFGGGPAGSMATWVMRLDSVGNTQWITPISDSLGYTEPTSISPDGAGGLYVCGWTSGDLAGTSAGGPDGWLARMGSAGGVLWVSQFGGGGNDVASAVALAPDQGAFVGGRLGSTIPFASPDGFLRRFRASGEPTWTVVTGTTGWDEFSDLVPNGSGGVFACGNSVAPVAVSVDAWYASYSGGGSLEFVHHVGDLTAKELGTAIDTDGGSGLVLAGWTDGSLYAASAGEEDPFVAHYDACELDPWTLYCTSTPNSTGKVALIGAYGSVHVTNNDFTLVSSSCPSGTLGLYLMSTTAGSTTFGNGTLCVGGSVLRLLPALSTGIGGSTALALDFTDPSSSASQVTAGSTWNFQFWYRDTAAGGALFNLSKAMSVPFCP